MAEVKIYKMLVPGRSLSGRYEAIMRGSQEQSIHLRQKRTTNAKRIRFDRLSWYETD